MLDIDSINLIDLVDQAGGNLKQVSGEWRGRCVLHNGDNSTAFSVHKSGDGRYRWNCFTRTECGGGDAVDFMMKWRNCDFKTAVQYLGGDTKQDPVEVAQLAAARAMRVEQSLKEQIEIAQRALEDLQSARRWLEYHENLDTYPETRELWARRGIPQVYQDYWQFGYSPSYRAMTKNGLLSTPTLTIPIYDKGWEILNIRHRLLNPLNPQDKYRPERSGLPAHPFMCDPDVGYDCERILILEGEIKAAVTYITMDDPKLQMIGIPGKKITNDLHEKLTGQSIWICLDPDAQEEADKLGKQLHARIITFPFKIDDGILKHGLSRQAIQKAMRYGRNA